MGRITNFLRRRSARFEAKLADLTGASPVPGVIGTIAAGDGMYRGDNAEYFEVGYSALRCIRLALLAAEKETVDRILDFGCGHGRVLRMLRAAFPRARLTACDINRGGADFCAETFGATAVYSAEKPGEIPLSGQFDLIWSGSVFTHLSEDRWPGFLGLLFSRLAYGGVAVLTTSGRSVAERLRANDALYALDSAQCADAVRGFDEHGFGFARQSSGGLDEWGISVSKPSWVVSQMERHPDVKIVSYTERAWANHQDVVSVVRISAE